MDMCPLLPSVSPASVRAYVWGVEMNLLHNHGPAAPLMVTMFNPGRCCVCGCTEQQPCDYHRTRALFWVDYEHTICAAPRCFKIYPRILRARRLHR